MRLVQSAGLWIRFFWDSLQASKSPQKPNNSNVINMHVCLLYASYHVHNIYCIKVLSSIQLCLALKLTGLMASSLSRAGDHGIFGHPKPAVQACRIPRIFQGFWAILSFQNLSESFRSYHFCVFSMFAWTIRNRCSLSEVDPSMLPYLYRSPAIWASGRTRKLHVMSMEIAPSLHLPAASMCSCPKTDWSDSHTEAAAPGWLCKASREASLGLQCGVAA